MEKVKLPIHKHPLLPFSRFTRDKCKACGFFGYIYGGYRCNELGCQEDVYHKECAESLQEISQSSHPNHPLKLLQSEEESACSLCGFMFKDGQQNYICSLCDFKLDLYCAKEPATPLLGNSNLHEHPLKLFVVNNSKLPFRICKICDFPVLENDLCYECHLCEYVVHSECAMFFPEANHTSHPQHPLKLLTFETAPSYIDMVCLLCGVKFDQLHKRLHHCDVCNITICRPCMKNPPPVSVESLKTHEHQLHLVPRSISFTCNACGTLGDRSPYFCLQCIFMIHWKCIDLPRVININRHDHRISYTPRLGGHGERKCKVCRKKVDGFYGAYTCVKCPGFVVHSLCAIREDVWDMRELEEEMMLGEEDEIAPFEVIDDNTIKHFSHDHNLQINNKDGHCRIQPENIVCEACVLQVLSEPYYSCKQCNFILHEKCANHPLKKRHVSDNQRFTLLQDSQYHYKVDQCWLCDQHFSGFRYETTSITIDVRCASISDTIEHGSHQHPLYFHTTFDYKPCSRCGNEDICFFRCDECEYILDGKCALYPTKILKNRYDDHPLVLCFGDMDVDGEYWCEGCETKVNPNEWFYSCNNCGTILHVSCVVGDFSYIMPGSRMNLNEEVVSNVSICRPNCSYCNSRCNLSSILKVSMGEVDEYFCSFRCRDNFKVCN